MSKQIEWRRESDRQSKKVAEGYFFSVLIRMRKGKKRNKNEERRGR